MSTVREASFDFDAQLRACVHCGLCLPTCPTYVVTGDEVESPRGRLLVIEDVLTGRGAADRGSLDRCLGCRNCETVCPSGVPYGALLEASRNELGPLGGGPSGLLVWIIDHVFADARRLAVAAWMGRIVSRLKLSRWMPDGWRALVDGLPARAVHWPRVGDLPGEGDVALLAGCAQPVYTPEVLGSAAALIRAAGGKPFVPTGTLCCGALSLHQGSAETARERVRQFFSLIPDSVTLVVPSAGCSAHLRELDALFEGEPDAERARALAARTVDLLEWLVSRVDRLRFASDPRTVVYHPPCHHTHAQRLVDAPFELLARVPDLKVRRIADEERCCGSAGSYSLAQPELAREVRGAKLLALEEAAPDFVLTANPGCELYVDQGLRESNSSLSIDHLARYLAQRLIEVSDGNGAG